MAHIVSSIDAFTHQGFIAAGKPNRYNEDRMVVGTNTFAVIDGATALVDAEKDGLNGSAYTARFLADYIVQQDKTDLSAYEILLNANKEFKKHLEYEWPEILLQGKLGPSAAVVLVRFHDKKRATVANIGDCSLLVQTNKGWRIASQHDHRHAELDNQLSEVIFSEMDKGLNAVEARKTLKADALLKKNRLLLNVDYGMFNAEESMAMFLRFSEVELMECSRLVLFSDGFAPLTHSTDEESAFKATADEMSKQGVYSYYQQRKNTLDADPLFKKYRRLKHMDDATGMVLCL